MSNVIHVLGFGGSLRKGSFSTALLKCAQGLHVEGVEVELFEEFGQFPIFNQDFEKTPPDPVARFKQKVRACDALLISTPEYNYSVPGYLKNAIDWASRPYGDNSFEGKPVAIMSESTGQNGGSRAQYHLRQTFIFLDMHPINRPEFMASQIQEKIVDGVVTDEHTKEKMAELLTALAVWTKRLKSV